MIKAAEDPQEVMADHEPGHIYYHNSFNSVIRSIGFSVIIYVLTGGNREVISDIINNLLTKSYSREIEARTDDFALELLTFQGNDPLYIASLF